MKVLLHGSVVLATLVALDSAMEPKTLAIVVLCSLVAVIAIAGYLKSNPGHDEGSLTAFRFEGSSGRSLYATESRSNTKFAHHALNHESRALEANVKALEGEYIPCLEQHK